MQEFPQARHVSVGTHQSELGIGSRVMCIEGYMQGTMLTNGKPAFAILGSRLLGLQDKRMPGQPTPHESVTDMGDTQTLHDIDQGASGDSVSLIRPHLFPHHSSPLAFFSGFLPLASLSSPSFSLWGRYWM